MGDLRLNGSTSGAITITPPAVAGTNTLTLPASTGTVALTDSSGNLSVAGNLTVTGNTTLTGALVPSSSFKRNRIINGNMVIDQRNAGASVTPATGDYTLDRWAARLTQASKFSVQQNAGSVTPPAGFSNYLGVTSLSAYSVGATDYFAIQQVIEGYNVADLGWGLTSPQPATLSFWVRSSLTGTFSGSLLNNAGTANYLYTYSIPAANTWTYITVSIPASSISGTFTSTTNGFGINCYWSLGAGSSVSGSTTGSWNSSLYRSATGAVSVVGTSGATFYITGVQFEVGTKATPYEMQIYSDQLAQCQRYYSKSYDITTVPGTTVSGGAAWNYITMAASVGDIGVSIPFKITMRTTPTVVWYSPDTGTSGVCGSAGGDKTAISQYIGTSSIAVYINANNNNGQVRAHWTASAEL
jgi:hypothetical protein